MFEISRVDCIEIENLPYKPALGFLQCSHNIYQQHHHLPTEENDSTKPSEIDWDKGII